MASRSHKKILIVDDEAFIRLLLEQTLEDLEGDDIEMLSADNGADALALVQSHQPDLVFLDVMIPRMSGFDVCRAIKHDLQMENVYVVILTAKGQEMDRQLSQDVGADLYMTKPFDPDELLELARKVLAR
jgi:two-component system, OmpR family, alkaline phosphatase synthesis response regulator PhoP